MKNIIKLLFLNLLFIPVFVNADSFTLNCNPVEVKRGDTITCSIGIRANQAITDFYAKVKLDGQTLTSSDGAYSDGIISYAIGGAIPTTTLNLKAVSSGSVRLTGGTINGGSVGEVATNITVKNIISTIKVNGESVNLNGNNDTYTVSLASSNGTYKVTAETIDNSTVTFKNGAGTSTSSLKLNYGETGTIIVSAGSESYKINITRKDERSNDNSLKSLTIGDEKVELTADKTEYKVEVANKIKKVKLSAEATNGKAKIEGTNEYDLAVGDNKLEIVVTAENGDEKTYKISVTRREVVNMNGKDNLSSLTVNGVKIKKITSTIFVNIANSEDKLKLEYDLIDDKGKVEYDEEYSIKEGVNKLKFTVYDSNDDKKEYTLIVLKEKDKTIVTNDDEKIIEALKKGDVTVKLTSKDDKIVSKKVLNKLNGNKLTYEIITDNDIILYSITFSGEKFEKYNKDINFAMEFSTKKDILKNSKYFNIRFLNDIVLPDKVIINVFLKDKYSLNDALYLYKYDGSKKLSLISNDLKKEDYYTSFKIDHLSEYVLNNDEIIIKKSPVLIIIIVVGSLVVAGGITFLIIKKRKGNSSKPKKVKKEKVPPTEKDITTEEPLPIDDEFSDLIIDNINEKEDK